MNDPRPLTDSENIQFANILNTLKGCPVMSCLYRNYRGKISERRFLIEEFWYGSTDWHPTPGLMLKAFDLDKGAMRDFCVTDFDISTLRIAQEETLDGNDG